MTIHDGAEMVGSGSSGYAEAVAAEIGARYGCAVSAAAVQVVPRGVSGLPQAVWVPSANGQAGKLVYAEPSGWRAAKGVARNAERKRGAAANPAVILRRKQVAEAHGRGLHDLAIAQELGLALTVVQADRRLLDLVAHPGPPTVTPAMAERQRLAAEVRRLHAQGMSDAALADALKIKRDRLKSIRLDCGLVANAAPRLRHQAKPRKLTDDALIARLDLGETDAQAAAVLKVSVSTVSARRRKLGRTANGGPQAERKPVLKAGNRVTRLVSNEEAVRTLRRLDAQGVTIARMAEELAVHPSTVWQARQALGLPRRETVSAATKTAGEVRRGRIAALVQEMRGRGDLPTVRGLARAVGCTKETVEKDLRRLELWPLRRSSDGVRDGITALLAKGKSRREIAAALDLTLAQLAKWLRRMKIEMPRAAALPGTITGRPRSAGTDGAPAASRNPGPSGRTVRMREKIAAMAKEGKSRREIAATNGLTLPQLAEHLRRMGIDLPRAAALPGTVTGRPRKAAAAVAAEAPVQAEPCHDLTPAEGVARAEIVARIRDGIAAMAAEGKSRREIAAALGLTLPQLAARLRRAGIDLPPSRREAAAVKGEAAGHPDRGVLRDRRHAAIRLMVAQGLTRREMAKRLDVDLARIAADIRAMALDVPRARFSIAPEKRRFSAAVPERRALVADLRSKGVSLTEIVRRTGVSLSTICTDIQALGVQAGRPDRSRMGGKQRRASDPDHAAQIVALWRDGVTVTTICSRLRFSRTAVEAVIAVSAETDGFDDRSAA